MVPKLEKNMAQTKSTLASKIAGWINLLVTAGVALLPPVTHIVVAHAALFSAVMLIGNAVIHFISSADPTL